MYFMRNIEDFTFMMFEELDEGSNEIESEIK